MHRGLVPLVLTLILALAGTWLSACAPIEPGQATSPVRAMSIHAACARAGKPVRPLRRFGEAIVRLRRHAVPATLTWDDDDDDDDDDSPAGSGAAHGSLLLVERSSPQPAVFESAAPERVNETRPRDPPRREELPPPRHA